MKTILLLTLSLALNGLLLGALIGKGRANRSIATPSSIVETRAGYDSFETRVDSNPEASGPEAAEPFHWSQLDTSDWFAYRDGLVQIGCPPETIREIIQPLVQRHYGGLCWIQIRPFSDQFWDRLRPPFEKVLEDLEASVKALKEEKNQTVARLFEVFPKNEGSERRSNAWTDYQLGFLPEETRPQVLERLKAHDQRLQKARESKFRDPQEKQEAFQNLQTQLDASLAEVLSVDELDQLKLRRSPRAHIRQLNGIDLTEAELLEVARVSAELSAATVPDDDDFPAREKEALELLLGPERAASLERAQDPQFQQLLTLTERLGVTPDQAVSLWKAQEAMEQQARQITGNSTRSETERQAQLERLREELGRQVETYLGGSRGRETWELAKNQWLRETFQVPEIDPVSTLDFP